jgi:hypothetical protein
MPAMGIGASVARKEDDRFLRGRGQYVADFRIPQSTVAGLQVAARTLGLQLVEVNARTDSDLEPAFANFSQQRVGAILENARRLRRGNSSCRGRASPPRCAPQCRHGSGPA